MLEVICSAYIAPGISIVLGLSTSSLREKCPYSEFFWSVFSCNCAEYGEIPGIFPYSVRVGKSDVS